MTVAVDIVSDVICPWCFVGKRRLDRAVAGLDVEIRWHPFLLDASIPPEGMERKDYLTRKFGAARVKTIHDPLLAAAKADGVPFHMDRITRTPNTLNAHRLLRLAHGLGRQHDLAERLFIDYWSEGRDVGDARVLVEAATAVGLDGTEVAQMLESETGLDAVNAEIAQAAEFGITGVPTFIIGKRYAVVGAQAPEVLKSAITRAALEARHSPSPLAGEGGA